jgi:hypothetical protein
MQGTSGPFGTDYVLSAHEDSRGVVWTGTKGAINRIDLKTGRYTVQPIGENTEVDAITQDKLMLLSTIKLPFTSNFCAGVVVPIPTLPEL